MAEMTSLDAPVPLSFPAFLRNPGVADRFAQLAGHDEPRTVPLSYVVAKKHKRSDDNIGKRWVRRKDNARLAGNPHITTASKGDYLVPIQGVRTTFQSPLQPYLERNMKLPTAAPRDARMQDINAGRFSLSLKGMRKDIRARDTYRTRLVAHTVDRALKGWINESVIFLAPGADEHHLSFPGREITDDNGEEVGIWEVARTPTKLIWNLGDDPFARYLVHCCARWYEVVSFSKETDGYRLMHLLRPNVSRPNPVAPNTIDTPPATDFSAPESDFSSFESDLVSHLDSDFGDVESEAEASHQLEVLSEAEGSVISEGPQQIVTTTQADDVDADASGSEVDVMASSLDLLSFDEVDPDETLRPIPEIERPVRLRTRVFQRSLSTSSPSPVRRTPRKAPRLKKHAQSLKIRGKNKCSFYEYIFS